MIRSRPRFRKEDRCQRNVAEGNRDVSSNERISARITRPKKEKMSKKTLIEKLKTEFLGGGVTILMQPFADHGRVFCLGD